MPVLRTKFPFIRPYAQIPERTEPRVLCKQDCRMKKHALLWIVLGG